MQERDKLSRIIRVAARSMKQSDKMSPASYRRQMKALIGNQLLVKLRKTPRLKIAKGLGEQYAGDDHLQDVIESMNKQSQYLRANDIEKATAHKAKVRALEIAK